MAKKLTKKQTTPAPLSLNITLPTRWGDLTPEQVTSLAYHLSLALDRPAFLTRLALEFGGLMPHGSQVAAGGEILYLYYHRDAGNIPLTADQVAALAEAMAWVESEPDLMVAPMLDGLTAPDHRLYGVTLEQFMVADAAFTAYSQMHTAEPLQMLAATLYPASRKFDPERMEGEAARLSYMPGWMLEAVALWFASAKKWIATRYPLVFSGGGDGGGEAPGGDEALLNILSALNEGRVVDNERLKVVELHEALHELNNKIKVANSLKSK